MNLRESNAPNFSKIFGKFMVEISVMKDAKAKRSPTFEEGMKFSIKLEST